MAAEVSFRSADINALANVLPAMYILLVPQLVCSSASIRSAVRCVVRLAVLVSEISCQAFLIRKLTILQVKRNVYGNVLTTSARFRVQW